MVTIPIPSIYEAILISEKLGLAILNAWSLSDTECVCSLLAEYGLPV
jgi:hypothetical protein